MPCCFVNSVDLFCYVCREVTLASQRPSIKLLIKKAYHLYFGCKLGDQDKKWAQHTVCISCAIGLGSWITRKGMTMPRAVPVVWKEPSNHSSDCYFCLITPVASGMNRKKKQRTDYPNNILCHQTCVSWGRSARAGTNKRLHFEFGDGKGRHEENRTSRRRTFRSRLSRSRI